MYVCVYVFMPMETVLYACIFTIIYPYIHVCSYSCSQGLLVADSSISSDRLYLHSQASPPAPPHTSGIAPIPTSPQDGRYSPATFVFYIR